MSGFDAVDGSSRAREWVLLGQPTIRRGQGMQRTTTLGFDGSENVGNWPSFTVAGVRPPWKLSGMSSPRSTMANLNPGRHSLQTAEVAVSGQRSRRFADLLRRVENWYHSFQHQRSSGEIPAQGMGPLCLLDPVTVLRRQPAATMLRSRHSSRENTHDCANPDRRTDDGGHIGDRHGRFRARRI